MTARKIFAALLKTLGGLSLLMAALQLVAAIHAAATIPAGEFSEAGFGFALAFFFGIAGLALFGVGRKIHARPPAARQLP